MNEAIAKKLQEYGIATEAYLSEYFRIKSKIPEKLYDSMLYSINAGGKRLRPALLLGTFETFSNKQLMEAEPFAASIEMIHTYSLIHDDLPSMDNDNLRRGKPSNHIVYGESGAILAGDALLNSAMENLLNVLYRNCDKRKLRAALTIMEAAGATGMIGGQVLDIEGTYNGDSLAEMHSMKTGALIKAAVLAGGILGGSHKNDEIYLEDYSHNLGCAFQIKDDILDVESTSDILGKPIGSDSRNEKTTYTSLYGLETAKKMLNDRIIDSLNALNGVDRDTGFLEAIAVHIRDRKD
ncbi:MAG: polyprenyl synthetase family protein [Clostridiales bacterium]|nr:polyprenyl synthetase family protein [Clostridiales bacterium]